MITTIKTSKSLFLSLVLALVLMPAMAAGQANDLSEKDQAWWDGLHTQLLENLDNPIHDIRLQALQHIVFFSEFYSDKFDFEPNATDILAVYETETDVRTKQMALAAFHATGAKDRLTMQYVLDLANREKSKRLQAMARAIVQDRMKVNS